MTKGIHGSWNNREGIEAKIGLILIQGEVNLDLEVHRKIDILQVVVEVRENQEAYLRLPATQVDRIEVDTINTNHVQNLDRGPRRNLDPLDRLVGVEEHTLYLRVQKSHLTLP